MFDKLKKARKAMINRVLGILITVVLVVVGFVVIAYTVGSLAPTLTTAMGNITGSGLPLASLFSSNGVLVIIFMIAVFLALILLAFSMIRGGKKGY